jgi:hypothetical protein
VLAPAQDRYGEIKVVHRTAPYSYLSPACADSTPRATGCEIWPPTEPEPIADISLGAQQLFFVAALFFTVPAAVLGL